MSCASSKRKRRFHARSKSGCLTCRTRRKRCTEEKPVCIGCSRNFLLCSWPSSPKSNAWEESNLAAYTCPDYGADPEQLSDLHSRSSTEPECTSGCLLQAQDKPPLSLGPGDAVDCLLTLYTAPSNHPKTLTSPGERKLFQHFVESTSAMLAVRGHRQNPFVTCLLPLAMVHDSIMHAVIAISGSHYASSFQDEALYTLGRQHYGVAIRSAKHQITRIAQGMCKQPLVLLALLLALCQFEVIPVPPQVLYNVC
jgi:hypothetical protein